MTLVSRFEENAVVSAKVHFAKYIVDARATLLNTIKPKADYKKKDEAPDHILGIEPKVEVRV